ncbi:MAG: hypothetical protein KatS3mg035_1282 [Bacteroidia bacterium]|nr:MAG: hypothetical protein KatS3mg035_1282 [Bacteroidia bacterium]
MRYDEIQEILNAHKKNYSLKSPLEIRLLGNFKYKRFAIYRFY